MWRAVFCVSCAYMWRKCANILLRIHWMLASAPAWVCVCVCAHACVSVCVAVCVRIGLHVCVCCDVCAVMCVCLYFCVYNYVLVCVPLCLCIGSAVCDVCMCVYTCVYVCICDSTCGRHLASTLSFRTWAYSAVVEQGGCKAGFPQYHGGHLAAHWVLAGGWRVCVPGHESL